MKRLALTTVAVSLLALTACQNKNQDAVVHEEEPFIPLDQMDTASATEPDMFTPRPVNRAPAPAVAAPIAQRPRIQPQPLPQTTVVERRDEVLTPTSTERTHVVRKGDTLYRLARQYYSDQSKWRKIWEANRATVSNPDRIYVGTKLVIP